MIYPFFGEALLFEIHPNGIFQRTQFYPWKHVYIENRDLKMTEHFYLEIFNNFAREGIVYVTVGSSHWNHIDFRQRKIEAPNGEVVSLYFL